MEYLAYLLVILGIVGDEITTRIGLTRGLAEGNIHTAWLIQNGLWLLVDILILTISILLPKWVTKRLDFPGKEATFAFPVTVGLLRFSACLWNLKLLLQAV